jgi:hypothetical protein
MAAGVVSSDASSYGRVIKMSVPLVAQELEELLGAKLVAYIAGVTEARAVRKWSRGEREPRPAVLERLRTALQVALMIAESDGPGVAQAWFQGLNPQLDDRSPARLLREGDVGVVGPDVLGAARAFVVGV